MFELSDFYSYARENDIDVMPYSGAPQPGATIRDGGYYAVALDFAQITTTRMLRSVCMHEQGHCMTGALHKISSPYELVARNENKACRASFEKYLPPQELQRAMDSGYREPWQMADFFDLPEEDIKKALHYWTQCRGVKFD